MSEVGVEEQISTAAPDALTENTAQAPAQPEVDFERILAGDEEYAKQVNEQLALDAPPVETAATDEQKPEEKASAEAAEKTAAPDPNEVVETITYRGQEVPIKRSQMKDLLQKGRHLEVRLEEVAPLMALAREVPELAEKLRTPEGRRQVVERIRQEEKARQDSDDDVPEVEGYDKDDVKAVDKILRARMKALGIVPPEQAGRPTPEQQEAFKRDQEDLTAKTRITLESLRSVDPNYETNMALLKEVVAEVERTTPPAQFREFYNIVNDPRKIDPSTGRPAFLNFYADIDKERARRESLETKPAAPAIPAVSRKAQSPSGLLAPGSAASPVAATQTGVLKFESQTDFDRAFNEALARG